MKEIEEQMQKIKQRLEQAKSDRIRAEARMDQLKQEEQQLLKECEKLGVQPEQLADEIARLENELNEEMAKIWEMLPAELKK